MGNPTFAIRVYDDSSRTLYSRRSRKLKQRQRAFGQLKNVDR